MKASLRCALAKLRRKKIPNLFLWICILITASLMVNAWILLKELNPIFDRAYEEMDGSQMCCLWNREMIPTDIVRQYLEGLQEDFIFQITENTKTIDYIEINGRKLSNGILLELPETINGHMLSPKILTSKTPKMPGQNEIWITTKMANILDIETGDHLVLRLADQAVTVNVANIVADPVFGGSSTNVYRMWCGAGQLSGFPLAENNVISYLEIQFQEYTFQKEQDFIRNAEAYFHTPLGESLYTYDRIKGGYTALYQMIGQILCFVSVVLAAAVIALTLFLIRSDMEEDVRSIGIYKSLGMTAGQITGIYLICYGTIGFLGACAGSILGGGLSKIIITKILGDMGIFTVSFTGVGIYQLYTGILVMIGVVALCFCAVLKVRRLNAASAIRTGAWHRKEQKYKEPKEIYTWRGSFSLYYAVRGIPNKKLRFLYIAGISLIFGCLIILGLGCLNAVRDIDQEPEIWGFIKTDIYVTSLEETAVSDIIEELENAPQVRYTYGVNKIVCQFKPEDGETWQNITTEVYELPWHEKIKDRFLKGRRPLHEDEVGIGLALSQKYGLDVGESMELMVNGRKAQYKITGIFQTLSNYGNVVRMVTVNLDQFVRYGGAFGDYMLVLDDGVDKWEYAKELAKEYGGKFSFIASKSNGENISGILVPAMGTILAILFVVVILITLNLTFLLIRHEQRMIGLLKAIGMTPWQIVKIYSWRNGLSAIAGNSLGLIFGIVVVPKLLTPYARLLGLSEFPFVNSLEGMAVTLLFLPVCMVLGTCVIIKTISRISIKQLVSE